MTEHARRIFVALTVLCALSARDVSAGLSRELAGPLSAIDAAAHDASVHSPSRLATPLGSTARSQEPRLVDDRAWLRQAEANSYSLNNPVNFVDPTGNFGIPGMMLTATMAVDRDLASSVWNTMIRLQDRPIESSFLQVDDLAGVKGIVTGVVKAAGLAVAGAVGMVVAKEGAERIAKEAAEGVSTRVSKAVNSNLPHAVTQGVERSVFTNANEAGTALRSLTEKITSTGAFPSGTLADTARKGRFLVPVGNKGLAVYQLATNGTAKLKTVLIAR